ncbi:hypothetical protein PLESTB_000759500 [Pleodorina starrii]|uniref:BRISC and BRCA1-A complex member 2 n=1 Tax=Pleodorina starrii TaxID=330485 RepID=A0A9W6BK02_9CHLO|nr:hypothetical protein PLESTM_001575300 [Pleodorina starrii]GLC53529.1 hypothetical protein PLESTB_000759500 [Pleodorina starrii]GLC65772.1 hypothetical protein PLESTF_000338300 [Pleodorina starrii]
MENLQQQVQYVSQALQCSATLEHLSPGMRVCHLAIPWCGRHIHWQVLFPPPPHSAPDVLFDDDSFQPLCGPPRPHYPHAHQSHAHSHALEPGRPGSSQAALRALLRSWSSPPHPPAPAASAAAGSPQQQLPADPKSSRASPPDQLCRLVSLLLDCYREHQLARLGAAAVALPRLQFELSTLEQGPGVQLELQQQQACFSLRLPPLDLRRLLDLAQLYGAQLPPPLQQQQQQPGAYDAAQPPGGGQGRGGSPDADADAGSGWELPLAARHQGSGRAPHLHLHSHPHPHPHPYTHPGGGSSHTVGQGLGVGSGPAGQPPAATGSPVAAGAAHHHQHHQHHQHQALPSGWEFALLASFRLPAAAGSGDLADPELTLQLPRALQELKAQETGGAAAAAAAAGGGGGGPSLVPSFLLPLWSPHMCLAEYVPLAVERLQAQLDSHCNTLAARQQLFEHLGELLGPPLELNMRGGAALFVVAWEGAPVLLSLELGPRFPTDKPAVVLQCARVLPGADPSRTYRDYPWSPRWGASEMAARIHNWLQEELPSFTRGRIAQS